MSATDLLVVILIINAIDLGLIVYWIWNRSRVAHRENQELLLELEQQGRSTRHTLKNLTEALRVVVDLTSEVKVDVSQDDGDR